MSFIRLFACALALAAGAAQAEAPATIRVDYTHSGNALSEQYALERVLVEPLPWPGDLTQNIDRTDRGLTGDRPPGVPDGRPVSRSAT
ncbi:MAG: hypothetical protein JF619_13385, partial [Massilia sp.]|nr:hypothetical protein [Massilia sp.]